jgi:hypothetical protein
MIPTGLDPVCGPLPYERSFFCKGRRGGAMAITYVKSLGVSLLPSHLQKGCQTSVQPSDFYSAQYR